MEPEETLEEKVEENPEEVNNITTLTEKSFFSKARQHTVKATTHQMLTTTRDIFAAIADLYLSHRYKVKTRTVDGVVEYYHPDEETTHIINYIAGKEQMYPEEQLGLLRDIFEYALKKDNIKHPDFSKMDKIKFAESVLQLILQNPELDKNTELKIKDKDNKTVEWVINDLFNYLINPFQRKYNSQVYETLWQIEQEAGSPKIRWKIPTDHTNTKGKTTYTKGSYSPLLNTICIEPIGRYGNPARSEKTIYGELAHGIQFNKNHLNFILRGLIEDIQKISIIMTGKSVNEVQLMTYSIPGTLEYEAHKIIEPQLRKQAGLK